MEGNRRFNSEQAADYLGISISSLYTLCRRREIPHYRIGSKYLFRPESLDNWIDEKERCCTVYEVTEEEAFSNIRPLPVAK